MSNRAFHFSNAGFGAFTIGYPNERVSLVIGPHAQCTTFHMTAAEARDMAAALYAAAMHAEAVLATGLGESAVDHDGKAAEARARIDEAMTGRGQ